MGFKHYTLEILLQDKIRHLNHKSFVSKHNPYFICANFGLAKQYFGFPQVTEIDIPYRKINFYSYIENKSFYHKITHMFDITDDSIV